ncbi:MAG: S41 family peptidase [Muribaculaceae bacterium]|nr:S41 family peptidase [Roseburia sp.]MCM1432278.1 S41 family peptidase [Muribaculaceae bacterium]MCM1494054.1 S41 family peptidase [Muribaculaceae bacterium]
MKKSTVFILICILLDISAIALIFLNLFLFSVPEFVCVLLAVCAPAAAVWFLIKSSSRKITKAFICILSLCATVIFLFEGFCFPYWNGIMLRANANYYSKPYDYELNAAEAAEDLNYAMKYFKKLHPALQKEIPEEISRQYESVREELAQCDRITVNALSKKIESVFSILQDGHSFVTGNYEDRRILKYVRGWNSEGYAITAVNSVPIAQLLADNHTYYSYEVESWALESLSDDIVTLAGLDYLGFDTADGITYTLSSDDGQTRTEICYSPDYLTWEDYAEYNHIGGDTGSGESFVRYVLEPEHSLAILTLDECEYNEEYTDCLQEMFAAVKSEGIQNVAVDIRGNGGGNDMVVWEFLRYLDIDEYRVPTLSWRWGPFSMDIGDAVKENERCQELLFDGNLYLLTSAGTFSSAMEFAEAVKDNHLGTIIGEAPGNNPNGYGEVVFFKLPNSEAFMQISTKRFYRADRECTDSVVMPDIECDGEEAVEELYRQL